MSFNPNHPIDDGHYVSDFVIDRVSESKSKIFWKKIEYLAVRGGLLVIGGGGLILILSAILSR